MNGAQQFLENLAMSQPCELTYAAPAITATAGGLYGLGASDPDGDSIC